MDNVALRLEIHSTIRISKSLSVYFSLLPSYIAFKSLGLFEGFVGQWLSRLRFATTARIDSRKWVYDITVRRASGKRWGEEVGEVETRDETRLGRRVHIGARP